MRNGVTTDIRDSTAATCITGITNRTGAIGQNVPTYAQWQAGADLTYPTIANGTPYPDSNADGIQDGWAGMPGGSTANQVAPNGYTYLENFLNELAGDVVAPPVDTPPAPPTGVTVT